jgi:hypothetical protein
MDLKEVERQLMAHPRIYSRTLAIGHTVYFTFCQKRTCSYTWRVFHMLGIVHSITGGGPTGNCAACHKIFSSILPPADTFLQRRQLARVLRLKSDADACTMCYGRRKRHHFTWGMCVACFLGQRRQEDCMIRLWVFLREVLGGDVSRIIYGMLVCM